MSPPTWRLFVSPPAAGADNMALDEALMARARATGQWVLRVYAWSSPTISFGRNQTARGRYDLDAVAARGIGVVRRPTGGRAILHDHEITYSVTGPAPGAPGAGGEGRGGEDGGGDGGGADLRSSYARINRLLVAALDRLGVAAAVAPSAARASAPGIAPCFAEPSAGELTHEGRKLAGSAQWRCDGALLQHGSILVDDDQRLLADLSVERVAPLPPAATLAGALGRRPAVDELAHAFRGALRDVEGAEPTALVLEPAVRARAAALVVRYLDDAWTWRR